ncbi:uncharacterized protein COLE_02200 [Cutaneotrichosporon oleaginosum]|uniref:uncharacterized protein n=1 Tax=Cutaneotrichosporon oleaginosum TaxID=879819 RepID=UPI00132AA3E8|nr:hypothetical protein COLE_02200 [Cutaneotrichosporon oleaginosum]
MTMWHPAMYGFEPEDLQYSRASQPIAPGSSFNTWWFRGDINKPPAEGQFLELPAGGVFTGQISNNKVFTDWGKKPKPDIGKMASSAEGVGLLHTRDMPGIPPEQTKESDVHKIQPEDFAIISTNRYCPWYRDVDFAIPKDLPACPPGGCHCMWGWIHNERGGGQEMYFTGYRCNVTGATGVIPIPKPAIARKCPYDKNNCTIGAKQPHYWLMGERNNNHQGYSDAPFYNEAYGFAHGAQNDLWDIDLGTTWNNNASEQAPIPDTYGKWNLPIIQRDPNASIGKATAAGAVNAPDANATPANSSPSASASSVAASGSVAATNSVTSASGSVSAASVASASGTVTTEPALVAPVVGGGDSNLKVDPVNGTIPESSTAGGSAGASGGSPMASPSANTTTTGAGVSNSTAPGTGNSAGVTGAGYSAPPSVSSHPKKCKRSRKRFGRRRL